MRAFKISEISAVDRPAQSGARAAIMKRDDDAGDELGELLKAAAIITKAVGGHGHIVSLTDGSGALLTGGLTAHSADPGRPRHAHPWIIDKAGRVVIGEAEGHTHDVDHAEATNLLRKIVKASIASAELGIPADLPDALLDVSDEAEYDLDGDMTADQRRAAARRDAMRRDRAERESALNPPTQPRTLGDLDDALERRAAELARENETVAAAFSRLVGARGQDRDDEFAALLAERERVARLGAGYSAEA